MGNGVVKGTKTLGPVWAGSERSGGERSEPPRSVREGIDSELFRRLKILNM